MKIVLALLSIFLFFVSCANNSTTNSYRVLSSLRNVQYDDIKPNDPNQKLPLWATNISMYERTIKKKHAKYKRNKYVIGDSVISSRKDLDICYDRARLNAVTQISSQNVSQVDSTFKEQTTESDNKVHSIIKSGLSSSSESSVEGLKREDKFYQEVKYIDSGNIEIRCFLLFSLYSKS